MRTGRTQTAPRGPRRPKPVEVEVRTLRLKGPMGLPKAEVSGMGWWRDRLVLLPQYPQRQGNALFTLSKAEVERAVAGEASLPEPRALAVDLGDLEAKLPGFQGFESMVIRGDEFFFTVETRPLGGPRAFLVGGKVEGDQLKIDTSVIRALPRQTRRVLENLSYEALVPRGEELWALTEANGSRVNAGPRAIRFSFDRELRPLGDAPMATLEYRLTDATAPDESGRFWVLNFRLVGRERELSRSRDMLTDTFGRGRSHAGTSRVERLVSLEAGSDGVRHSGVAPIQLKLQPGAGGRNWEAIAPLDDRGFLIMTDKYPGGALGFVTLPTE